jgi:hypothetical protein
VGEVEIIGVEVVVVSGVDVVVVARGEVIGEGSMIIVCKILLSLLLFRFSLILI